MEAMAYKLKSMMINAYIQGVEIMTKQCDGIQLTFLPTGNPITTAFSKKVTSYKKGLVVPNFHRCCCFFVVVSEPSELVYLFPADCGLLALLPHDFSPFLRFFGFTPSRFGSCLW